MESPSHTAPVPERFAGRRVLVTGAGGGIARAAALRIAREGGSLALTDIDPEAAETAAQAVRETGAQATAIAADVTDRDSVDTMVAQAAKAMGGVDVLVTCAGGYTAYARFNEIADADWDRVIALNLRSVFLCCTAVLPHMKEAGWGRIVNLGSLAGRSTSAGSSPAHYAAAKAGVAMMTQYLAKDVAAFGITANTVAPGTTRTPRVDALMTAEKEAAFTKMTPVGRLAEPGDIAGVIAFLASEDARYMTGATLDVNGGRLMLV
ncbi:SDR family NAD(P)-dependent oxidoreductase [Chelativorans sp. M5D2P16]|uniref:SDR family NAD(P)-dependent oxidoreductase n=1 Tax=Chelativorans sp. M5D2P16 TaxID=3095678 RepID=UPI002ACADB97|nr:SDR family NAD(P)-dependent oxidoreductase [Chelativorans sp. M5D2P16]MDZ5696616.1 SDR family NAD(P)-dependent oxidoreductase [Chelativorans sp. M5D2P16]